ncbi:MAG TPA: sugar-binding protein [Planctomycetota bacterium]|jgi:hypothetical protein|nr:sugar-binding protein [Planctomycetota bacterium]
MALLSRFQEPTTKPAVRPIAGARRVEQAPKVDGDLSDPVWKEATPIGPLTQVEPTEGDPPSQRTEVRVLFDADALYVGIRCFEADPSRIVATQMARDSEIDVDDEVSILFDTFLDRRNAYLFEMNPAGARSDALLVDNGSEVIRDWDGIWEGASRIDAEGWTVEIAIPFKTLAFAPERDAWGFNVQRKIKRLLETDRWSGARQDFAFRQVAEAGTLTGLTGMRGGKGLDVRPFTALRQSRDREAQDSDLIGKSGLDLLVRLAPALRATVTANTDFAETEVDDRQTTINLTRFPLFIPEKRSFFLEDAGIFGFGGLSESLTPFFSRRIGLSDDGREIPIDFGAKITGRTGPWNVGVLDTQMREADDISGKNLFVARVSRNILEQSSVGFLVTRGNPTGPGMNSVVGADTALRTDRFLGDKNLVGRAFVLRSDDAGEGSGLAYGASLASPNDLVDAGIEFRQIGEDFRPALGFVERTGVRSYAARLSYQPRPGAYSVRQLFFEFEPEVITDLSGRTQTARLFLAPVNVNLESGDSFEFNVIPQYERIEEPTGFVIHDGVTIPQGGFSFVRYRIQAEGATKRPLVPFGTYRYGGFFDGHQEDLRVGLTWKPSRYLQFTGQDEHIHVRLDEGEFAVRIYLLRANVNFTPDVAWSTLLQWDNQSDSLGFQSRLRFIRADGQEAFLVLNTSGDFGDFHYTGTARQVTLKLEYTLRF